MGAPWTGYMWVLHGTGCSMDWVLHGLGVCAWVLNDWVYVHGCSMGLGICGCSMDWVLHGLRYMWVLHGLVAHASASLAIAIPCCMVWAIFRPKWCANYALIMQGSCVATFYTTKWSSCSITSLQFKYLAY